MMNTIDNAIDPKAKPAMMIATYARNVKPIRKYIVGLGNKRESSTTATDRAEERMSMPTMGTDIFAMMYPKPVFD